MSSHHIVRDNQEPALLFLDIASSNKKILEQLLEWSPFIIATEETNLFLESWDVQADKVLKANSKNDLIRKASEMLSRHKQTMVNVICNTGDAYQFENKPYEVIILDGGWKWSFIHFGKLKKWFPKSSQLALKSEVIDISNSAGRLTISEIKNISDDGIICFESKNPFWLGEKIV